MNNGAWFVTIMIATVSIGSVSASQDHDKSSAKEEAHEEDGHKHGEGEEAEESANVGPNKGITEADEHSGFKLSPEALKNFDLKVFQLSGRGPWKLPSSAIVRAGEETNLYRVRDGFYKRIDFQTVQKAPDHVVVISSDIRENDGIIISGVGFLRIAELAAFGGVSEGHSH